MYQLTLSDRCQPLAHWLLLYANSECTDKMLYNATFHQGIRRLLRQTGSSKKEKQYHLKIITYDPFDIYNGPFQIVHVSNLVQR